MSLFGHFPVLLQLTYITCRFSLGIQGIVPPFIFRSFVLTNGTAKKYISDKLVFILRMKQRINCQCLVALYLHACSRGIPTFNASNVW